MGGYPGVEAGAENLIFTPSAVKDRRKLGYRLPSLMPTRVGRKVAAPCRGEIARLLTRGGRSYGTRRGR
jgi:hypothetical protein